MTTTMNGYSTDPPTTTITVNGKTATVRKGDVALIFLALGWLYHHRVEPVVTFNGYRSASTNTASGSVFSTSNHRSATAVDINGYKWPYQATHRNTYKPMPAALAKKVRRKVLKKLPCVRWGQDFPAPYGDPMHFEITGNTATTANKLRGGKYKVKRATWLHDGPKGGTKNRTRKLRKGTRVTVVLNLGKWALTAKGDWIRMKRVKK
ncbi:D-alanyl-D-alanine carboxypeptidase [Micrococcales bacterium KH10]|nr:D-alanyl-D-alanine carboxypeptidase [Micrococcales bacterium KH10]